MKDEKVIELLSKNNEKEKNLFITNHQKTSILSLISLLNILHYKNTEEIENKEYVNKNTKEIENKNYEIDKFIILSVLSNKIIKFFEMIVNSKYKSINEKIKMITFKVNTKGSNQSFFEKEKEKYIQEKLKIEQTLIVFLTTFKDFFKINTVFKNSLFAKDTISSFQYFFEDKVIHSEQLFSNLLFFLVNVIQNSPFLLENYFETNQLRSIILLSCSINSIKLRNLTLQNALTFSCLFESNYLKIGFFFFFFVFKKNYSFLFIKI